jgi:protein-tyrosine-phosphatase/predicted ATP-grasp superfamily ATP-dependent carboligase
MAARHHVLVLDGDKVAALDIVRAFGRRGLSVAVAASRPDAIAFRSRFAQRCEIYPDPRQAPGDFVAWLQRSLVRDPVTLVVPVTDLTTLPIAANSADLAGHAMLATERFETLQVVCDKFRTIELARRVGVPVPRTAVVTSPAEVAALQTAFPVVCKPARSAVWSAAGFEATSVWYARDDRQFRLDAAKAVAICPVLVQEFTSGHGVGIELLAQGGELLQVFQHRRLHELPLSGGGSTYRISEAVDPRLRDYAARLMAGLDWTGVAMVEFRIDRRTGEPVLMEINGRFWGSLPLSSRAGFSFANDLYDLLVLQRRHAPRAPAVGVRCRKLADDIEWFKERLQVRASDPLVAAGIVPRVRRPVVLLELLRAAWPGEHTDVQVWWDPAPGLVDLRRIAATQLAMARRYGARAAARGWSLGYRARHRHTLLRHVTQAQRVLFVCYGNIMRSAFAEAYLTRQAARANVAIEARSVGFHRRPGRPADPRMVEAAGRRGVDLTAHSARTIEEDSIAWADVILAMDRSHLRALRNRYPAAAARVFLLSVLEPGNADADIPDPYSEDDAATDRVCERIGLAVDRLMASVASNGSVTGRKSAHERTLVPGGRCVP